MSLKDHEKALQQLGIVGDLAMASAQVIHTYQLFLQSINSLRMKNCYIQLNVRVQGYEQTLHDCIVTDEHGKKTAYSLK